MAAIKDWNKEIEKNKKQVEKDPTDSNAHYNLGWALIQSVGAKIQSKNLDAECKEKATLAESELKTAIELYQGHGRAHVLLAQLLRYLDRNDDSIESARPGLGLPPTSQDWFAAAETIASCYMLKNDMPHSIEMLETIKEHYPNDSMTIFKRACCYWEIKDFDKAEKEFEHLTKVDPSHPNAQGCLLQVRQVKANTDGHTNALKKESKPDPASNKVKAAQTKAQALGEKLSEDIQKVMASSMPQEKKSTEVTRLQQEFNDAIQKLMRV